MFAKIDNPKIFSEVVSIISELVTEVNLKFGEDGMSIVAIDPANVALVYFLLPRKIFSEYTSSNENLGVNLGNLKAVLRRAKSGSSLIMKSRENIIDFDIIDRVRRKFSLTLIDVEGQDKKIPQLEFLSQIQMSPEDFVDAIEDCLVVSESCAFIAVPEKFVIESTGLNSAHTEFSSDEVKIISGNSKARYSLEYLQKFIKASKLAGKVLINFSSDHPLKIDFKRDDFELSFILAPRVEEED